MRLRNEPLEKASGGTSYAEERRVRRTRLESRSFVSVCVVPHALKKKKIELIIWPC